MTPIISPRAIFEETTANMFSNTKYSSNYLFYAHLLGQCRVVFDPTLPAPAGVNFMYDHFNLYINSEGIEPCEEHPNGVSGFNSFPLEQRLGILKHEMLHILYNHASRKEDRDHECFNVSSDCAINQQIEKTHLPDWVITPENFPSKKQVAANLTAEQYYELIDKEFKGKSNSSGKGGRTLDDHSKWEESKGDSELQDDVTKNMIDRAVSNTQKSRGNIPGELSEWLSLVTHKRELNWKNVLRNIVGNKRVGSKRTLLRKDRRLPNFEWIKGRTKNRKFDLLVISDVSGSVGDDALLHLWGEVRNICDVTQTPVNLIQVDTHPSKPEQLKRNTRTIERKACGGTFLSPALEMAAKHNLEYNAIVITTDAYLDESDVRKFADTGKRVIWLIEADGADPMPIMNSGKMQAFKLTKN